MYESVAKLPCGEVTGNHIEYTVPSKIQSFKKLRSFFQNFSFRLPTGMVILSVPSKVQSLRKMRKLGQNFLAASTLPLTA